MTSGYKFGGFNEGLHPTKRQASVLNVEEISEEKYSFYCLVHTLLTLEKWRLTTQNSKVFLDLSRWTYNHFSTARWIYKSSRIKGHLYSPEKRTWLSISFSQFILFQALYETKLLKVCLIFELQHVKHKLGFRAVNCFLFASRKILFYLSSSKSFVWLCISNENKRLNIWMYWWFDYFNKKSVQLH